MSVILQVKINGGAPQSGDPTTGTEILAVTGNTIQLTAASKVGWSGSPPARWEMYDYPPGFALPAGWTSEAATGIYYYSGNEDPPIMTVGANWGKFVFNLSATESTGRSTDYNTGVIVLSPGGLKGMGRGEGGRFGGAHLRWVKNLMQDAVILSVAAVMSTVYTFLSGVASIKAATATFIRGVTTGGVYITPGADGAATLLAGRNADATTAKPLAIDLGTTPVIGDVTKYFTLRSGASDFLGMRRWRSDLGGGISGYETQISGLATDNPGAVSDYVTVVFNRLNFQPADIFEVNPGGNMYCGHGTGMTWFWRENGPAGYTVDVQLRPTGATTFKARAGVTGVEWSYTAADADGIGGTMKLRGQQGAAGFVGGLCEIGGGNGGAGAVAGATGVNLGTPVANVSGKFFLRREDGTRILEMYQGGADQIHISGGPAGAETQLIQIKGTFVNIEASSGHVSLVPNTDLYLNHGVGAFLYERVGGTTSRTTQHTTAGVSYSDVIAGVTSFEMRKGGSARITYDANGVTLGGGFCEVGGQVSSAPTSIAFTATPTFDCNTSNHHILGALTANVTAADVGNERAGGIYTIKMTQDATGGRTVAWAAKFKFGATYSSAVGATANMVTVWTFYAVTGGGEVRCIGKETYTS